jgi:hypothetical protein
MNVEPWPPPPYHDPEQRERRVAAMAQELGGTIHVYGTSVEGRTLTALKLPAGDGSSNNAPNVLCCANLHGIEWIGGLVALDLAAKSVQPGRAAFELRQRANLWIVPCANPDGYAATFRQRGDGTLAQLRTNANGVDLNRNFPRPTASAPPWAPGAGSSRKGDATYRGPAPLSEPESASLVRFMEDNAFVASANLHSFMGTFIPARVRGRHDFAVYCQLHRALLAGQKDGYRRLSSRLFDVFTGEQEDFQHHVLGTWAACIEVFPILASLKQGLRSSSLFARFNPLDAGRWIENDVGGVANFLLAALDQPPPQERYDWRSKAADAAPD